MTIKAKFKNARTMITSMPTLVFFTILTSVSILGVCIPKL